MYKGSGEARSMQQLETPGSLAQLPSFVRAHPREDVDSVRTEGSI